MPKDDIYTFALLSDDGSTLVIDGEQVIDNDGPHGPREVIGQKALSIFCVMERNWIIIRVSEGVPKLVFTTEYTDLHR